MSDPTLVNPLPYQPSFEAVQEDEAQATEGLRDAMVGMASTMFGHTGEATRAVHAKSHGLLQGRLEVLEGLPPQLAQGLFARPHDYPVLMRVSTPPAEKLPDTVSLPRALALKVLGVTGERVPGSEGDSTQDFLMVNGPAFGRPGPQGFLKDVKLLASTTDKAPRAKEVLSAVLRGTEKLIEAVGGESAKLKSLGGHPETHPLGETFFTQVPVLYGPYMAKFSLAPVSPALVALHGQPLHPRDEDNMLREAVSDFFAPGGPAPGVWELRVQLCTDIDKMPIEDAAVPWPEEISPYIAVARLVVPQQPAWSEARSAAVDQGMAFNPWHALAAHRPIGAVMRARKLAYAASAAFRGGKTGCPLHEPGRETVLPGL